MAGYQVYMYNIPKVSDDGKQSIPVPESQSKGFEQVEEARKFATGQKDKFDRVVLMEAKDDGQKMIERFVDGKFERSEEIVRR
jgi:hypothetical protein